MVLGLNGGPQFGIGTGDGLAGGKHGEVTQARQESGDFSPDASEIRPHLNVNLQAAPPRQYSLLK
jgi:hypothetical protein